MTVKFNHTIVAASDKKASALFMSEILGLDPPVLLGPFALVRAGDELTLDFVDADEPIVTQHYAFLVSESEFDEIFGRIAQRGLDYWADPHQNKPNEINHWDDGRGVYFEDPDGHLLEILTRPYGSAGTSADNPHPLVAETFEGDAAKMAANDNDEDGRTTRAVATPTRNRASYPPGRARGRFGRGVG